MIVAPRLPVDNKGMSFRNAVKVVLASRLRSSLVGVWPQGAAAGCEYGSLAKAPGTRGTERVGLRWAGLRWAGLRWAAVLAAFAVAGLTGCGADMQELGAAQSDALPGHAIQGNVHGGVYPIRNANIYLMQTVTSSTSTYGSAAKQLEYAQSDQNGYFTFSDNFTCASNEFAYIVVTSGNTTNLGTTTNNNDVVQVGAIGPCSQLSTTAEIDKINVFVSELSTVAAANALGNFISVVDKNDGMGTQVVNIGAPQNNSVTAKCSTGTTPMTCTAAGLAHAFTNATTLVKSVSFDGSFPNGEANFTNSLSSVSSIPAPLINTLGDILQNCVDSLGGAACPSLFTDATPTGGTAPTNTLQAALNIAKNPTTNITALFNLMSKTPPFTPVLSSAPTSFTICIFYGIQFNGVSGSSVVQYPVDITLDPSDNAYVLYANGTPGTSADTGSGVYEWYASGATASAGTLNTTYLYPGQIAMNAFGYALATNNDPVTSNDVVNILVSGVLDPIINLSGASGIALDQNNSAWVSSVDTTQASITGYTVNSQAAAYGTYNASTNSFTSATVGFSSGKLGATYGVAVDSGQNIWGAGLSSGGKAEAIRIAQTTANGGGISQAFTENTPFSVAFNSAGTAYFPVYQELASATYSGTTLTTNSAVATVTASGAPHRSEVDGAGNVFWTDLESSGQIYMYAPTAASPAPAVIGILPCFTYPAGSAFTCVTTSTANASNAVYTPANFRAVAIDSAGDLWCAADAGYGAVIETLGLAAPAWPLLSYGHPGVKPQ